MTSSGKSADSKEKKKSSKSDSNSIICYSCRNKISKNGGSQTSSSSLAYTGARRVYDPDIYPNAYEYPNPLSLQLSPEDLKQHEKLLTLSQNEMFDAFKTEETSGEELQVEFISTFIRHSIPAWPKGWKYKWCTLLRSRGVFIDIGQKHQGWMHWWAYYSRTNMSITQQIYFLTVLALQKQKG